MTLETVKKATKRRRTTSYRLGSGQTKPYTVTEELEETTTTGKEWRTKEARRESVYR